MPPFLLASVLQGASLVSRLFHPSCSERPASITPVRTKANALETQALGVDITFDCYGTPVTATDVATGGQEAAYECDGLP